MLLMKRFIFYSITVFALTTILFSCRKEAILESGGEVLFSVDTLTFDTVFTDQGSFTASLKIYNPQDQPVKLSAVRLADVGGNTPFTLNVDGRAGDNIKDVEIAANDSIYVFATVNIDPTNENTPFVVDDQLVATLNGRDYNVPFQAYGQNAYYLIDSLIDVNQTWKTDKPYVIINNAAVDENVTVTIPAGCRIYVHADSRLLVLGTLKVNGTKQDSVIFQGDRLDRKYFGNEGYPGEWGGIYFFPQSRNSEMNYAVLKNCGNSTTLGNSTFLPAAIQLNYDTVDDGQAQLVMKNTIIENSIGYGIVSFGSTLIAENCLINTCGAQCFAAFEGGGYYLDNCTFVTYGTDKVSHVDNPVMALLNYRDINNTQYVAGPLVARLRNCVVYGSLETEFFADSRGDINSLSSSFDVQIQNCLIKNKDGVPENVIDTANSSLVNINPIFENPSDFDFRPAQGSPLINAGANLPNITTDLNNKARSDGRIDIGCYEY